MKIFSLLLLLISLISCNNSQPLCNCIEAGDEVNRISATFFNRAATKAGEDSLNIAKDKRDRLCELFQEMAPKELHERASRCESLNLTPEQ
jgi:hypothetical protein